jgi:hypothetical protein
VIKLKLNPDCIRDILLTVEENTGYNQIMQYDGANSETHYEYFKKYQEDEVFYHIKQCELNGFFTNIKWYFPDGCIIFDLSPAGHEFLANIRTDNNWNKVKQKAKSVGSESLSVIAQIAGQVISAMLTQPH